MATKTTIHSLIEQFREAPSNAERGTKFEELMADYFEFDPTLASRYDVVKGWTAWEHNERTHDSGIDLVARDKVTGAWTAIQCKFYDPKHSLQKSDIDSFFTASGKSWDGISFANRIIISTTDRWSHHAETALEKQSIPVQRIGLADISESPIDWMEVDRSGLHFEARKAVRYGLRPHQKEAIAKIQAGFETHDRGQWISACGTGKTFTSLKLAEQRCKDNGGQLKALFLAPSISLVSQTLREWMAQSQTEIRPLVVCSDTKAGKQAEDISVHDIPLPTTDAERLAEDMAAVGRRGRQMTVVFSTYQSIDVVAQAQRASGVPFDLILCDEAHRTTGVTLAGQGDESSFVKVHDNAYLPAAKRLYMTATPRIYGADVKKKADEASALLTSMDDESVYGPEFHRFGFEEAVEKGLLTDYKVMILCVKNEGVADRLQSSLANDEHELTLDDAAKIVGCWRGLAKQTTDLDFGEDPVPMKRAVAFAANIKASKAFAAAFPGVVDDMVDEDTDDLGVEVHHVDGTMNAMVRGEELAWLKAPIMDGECRILSNARCLSEGVDVPALDAVLFLSPRNSKVDVVQSVGRVMRKAPSKDFGYIILPIAIAADEDPDKALSNNKRFQVVWDVLNALRAHDERFNAMINAIDLEGNTKGKIGFDVFDPNAPDTATGEPARSDQKKDLQPALFQVQQWKDAILARIVKKVGSKEYWDSWADDVVTIHTNQVTRIKTILAHAQPESTVAMAFERFLEGLRGNINESINADAAVDMLSQHLITRPVFEALFHHGSFAEHNPVSITMQAMVDALAGQGLEAEVAGLSGFYDSVRRSAEAVESPAGRQAVVHRLYEDFFKKAFPKQASSLGVVYTPVEIVDFILRAADDVCRQEFGYGLTDEGVHVLDPFTGTGTFIVRLLQSGIIRPEDLARKYASELWANEIMLLAYYIACVNIETTYQALTSKHLTDLAESSRSVELAGSAQSVERAESLQPAERAERVEALYVPFPGATFTDTFQMSEESDNQDTSLIPANNDRIQAQLNLPIRVIVGNPPYSAGQSSANDNNANLRYPSLDARVAETYAKRTSAASSRSTYDSYIRAFRWATDRIGDHGVIAFVSNNGWVDANSADGIRKTFADEFSSIWVYNLRGNQRTAGELSRKEGGKVFGSGARTGVAILILTKNPTHTGPCELNYHGVPDYQTREEKLAALEVSSLTTIPWKKLSPNDAGDWLNQRNTSFEAFVPIGTKGNQAVGEPTPVFSIYSLGVATGRDAWTYNFSRPRLAQNMHSMISTYNAEVATAGGDANKLTDDATRISWNRELLRDASRRTVHQYNPDAVRVGAYRPFCQQNLYFDRPMNAMVYQLERLFPTLHHGNVGILASASGASAPFTALAVRNIPDLVSVAGAGNPSQFFPRWSYERVDDTLLNDDIDEYGYRRVDNITDEIHALYRKSFGEQVAKDDIFFYVYGVLHSPQYRETFAADLKRMLPRIPLAKNRADFEAFSAAGRELCDLHIGYETVDPYPLHESTHPLGVDEWELYRFQRMKWADKTTKKAIVYNGYITLSDIPAEAHEYMLGSRSGLEWIIDRYQVKTDKASGIVNDPNDWCREHDDPRYIVDLVKRVTRVSVETMRIVKSLPELPL